MLRRYRLLILIISAAVVLFSYLIGEITFTPFERSWLRDVKSGPEYVMQNTTTVQYNEQGVERFRMKAVRLSQASDSKTVQLTEPQITLKKSENNEWVIKAETGQLNSATPEQQELLLLQQHVVVKNHQNSNPADGSNSSDNRAKFILETSELTISPSTKQALTAEPVVIRTSGVRTDAEGLNLDFERGIVKLDSQVRTTITRIATTPESQTSAESNLQKNQNQSTKNID